MCVCIHTQRDYLLYANLMATTKQKPTVDTQKIIRKESKHNTKEIHQTTREESLVHILPDPYSILLHANMHVEIDISGEVGYFQNINNTVCIILDLLFYLNNNRS